MPDNPEGAKTRNQELSVLACSCPVKSGFPILSSIHIKQYFKILYKKEGQRSNFQSFIFPSHVSKTCNFLGNLTELNARRSCTFWGCFKPLIKSTRWHPNPPPPGTLWCQSRTEGRGLHLDHLLFHKPILQPHKEITQAKANNCSERRNWRQKLLDRIAPLAPLHRFT